MCLNSSYNPTWRLAIMSRGRIVQQMGLEGTFQILKNLPWWYVSFVFLHLVLCEIFGRHTFPN